MDNEEDKSAAGPKGPYQPNVPESDSTPPIAESSGDEPDDSILQSASNDMGEEVGVPPPNDFKPKKGKKTFLLLFVVALIIGGAAAYYFLVYKKPAAEPAPTQQSETPVANSFTPENVAYAFRKKESDPFMLYLRPVAGGDRIESGELGEDAYPASDVNGQNVAVVFDNKLQVSTDGGKTYAQVLEPEAGQEITSASFNTDGSKLGVATLNTDKGENTISSMSLDGKNVSEVFTSKDHPGVRLMGWNNEVVIFDSYAPNSDGNTPNPYEYDIATKDYKQLTKPKDGVMTWSAAVSNDLKSLVYSSGKTDPNPSGIGATPLSPHTISVVDIESGDSKDIATVGKTGEKAQNGTALQRDTLVGFLVNETTPYYTDGGKLYIGEEPTVAYETKNDIVNVQFASDSVIIASSGTVSNFTLANFNVETKESTTILEGDDMTVLFGVTTK